MKSYTKKSIKPIHKNVQEPSDNKIDPRSHKLHFIFPLNLDDLYKIDTEHSCHKLFWIQGEPYIVVVGFKNKLRQIADSQSIKNGQKARFTFVFAVVTPALLKKIIDAEPGEDVLCVTDSVGIAGVSIINTKVYNALKEHWK